MRMEIACCDWLAALPEPQRTLAARAAMELAASKVLWGGATTLYDTGVVYRTAASPFVQPASPVDPPCLREES
jgi:hypothetical protein